MSAPTAYDLIRRSSGTTVPADSLAWALDLMTRKVERQESEIGVLRAQVMRLRAERDAAIRDAADYAEWQWANEGGTW